MRILIFSWRDIKNPKSGGAEIVTHELAKRWVRWGHSVTLVSASFPGAKREEVVEGIQIIRPAKFYKINLLAFWGYLKYLFSTAFFYQKTLRGKFDLVIDQVHGLPLFTLLFVSEKKVAFPLEVAKEIWFAEIPFPLALAGFFLEQAYLRLYRNLPFITISDSTKRDLKRAGVKNVSLIPLGLTSASLNRLPQKEKNPTIINLGRLTPMKRIEETIQAFSLITSEFPKAQLRIVGRGSLKYEKKLKDLATKLKIAKKVAFLGFVSEERKQELLKRAWALVSTSLREGFGLVVIEAGASGTPAIVYNVPGLCDSVRDKKTGLVCEKNTPENLAQNIKKLILDQSLREKLSQNALELSRKFNWDKSAKKTLQILNKISKS